MPVKQVMREMAWSRSAVEGLLYDVLQIDLDDREHWPWAYPPDDGDSRMFGGGCGGSHSSPRSAALQADMERQYVEAGLRRVPDGTGHWRFEKRVPGEEAPAV